MKLKPTRRKGKVGELLLREKFLIFPKCIDGKWRWWRRAMYADEIYKGLMPMLEIRGMYWTTKHYHCAWIDTEKDWEKAKKAHPPRAKRRKKWLEKMYNEHLHDREMERKYCRCRENGFLF